MRLYVLCAAATVLFTASCYGSDKGEKRPLSEGPASGAVSGPLPPGHPPIGASDQAGAPRTMITGAAKAALDSGNTLYKAKAYSAALAQYRRASTLAPTEEAPLVGMMMVANVTSNATLADSINARLRTLNGSLAGDSLSAEELKDIHAGVKRPAPAPPPRTSRKL